MFERGGEWMVCKEWMVDGLIWSKTYLIF